MRLNLRNVLGLMACAALVWVLAGAGHSENTPEKGSTEGAAQEEPLSKEIQGPWERQGGGEDWVAKEMATHTIKPPADNSHLLEGEQREGHAYGDISEKDILIWERELKKFVARGSQIFHNPDLLGSSIATSCDMCHPDASNTHPETYPKFQVETGRVILLRDMINWCLEQAVRAKPLEADDPKMRALEAYIYAQRKGTELNYGKH